MRLYSDVQVQEGMFDKDNLLKSAFCNFQELPFGYWKTFSHLWSCLKPAVFLLLFVCTKTFSKHVYINLYV